VYGGGPTDRMDPYPGEFSRYTKLEYGVSHIVFLGADACLLLGLTLAGGCDGTTTRTGEN